MGRKLISARPKSRIDGLERERKRIGKVLAAQAEHARDHLHNDRHEQTDNRHDDDEGDQGIEALKHTALHERRSTSVAMTFVTRSIKERS